jgi:3-oxoadipate enol-lactonase/4-carboxymuconolactone decarboxylase|tara:strand:- start:358 stop:1158 length:801 start_codon:yes stop_codon:yes gene_type:complete
MTIAPDGTRYELTGPKSAPVVILIHGLGLNKDCWQWLTPDLVNSYRILSYDLYGHGGSVDPTKQPSLSLFSKQLSSLLDHCDISQGVIVGFSLGGMIARRFAQDAPKRSLAMIILHSPHTRSEAAQASILARVDQARIMGPQSTVEAALERWFTSGFMEANPNLMDKVRQWVIANSREVYHTIYSVLATGIDEIVKPNPALTLPSLVLTGEEDFGNGPEMADAIAVDIEGAKVLVFPGLRHMALVEAPTVVNKPILEFLDGLDLLD